MNAPFQTTSPVTEPVPSTVPSPGADIRTFRAADTRAALAAIRAALGDDAVILQTRQIPRLFGRAEIEVTAGRSPVPSEIGRRRVARYEDERARDEDLPSHPRETAALVPQRSDVFRQMVDRGVDEALASGVIQEAVRRGAGRTQGDLLAQVTRLVREQLRPAPAPWHPLPAGDRTGEAIRQSRIIALIGPTGVGKTTTLAKIAARALLEAHLKVALVTVDTYRLGASDQLARYGKIMGVRTQVARDAAALVDATRQFADADLILIDTAGRSDRRARKAQADLLRAVPGVELHLVLSAATGAREISAMARHYQELEPDHLVFSKLDESSGPGCVLSAAMEIPRSVTCVTDGQRVPEDIHPVTSRLLSSLVFSPKETAEGTAPWTKPTASDS
jgi:flagellar biosynthesis protein FlhF